MQIPALVLKKCSPELTPILSKLYHLIISGSEYPKSWMTANVLPIPKKGDPSDLSNYRPIALRSILSKLFETLLNNQILSHFESFQILQNTQYEFSKQISTTDLLISITNRFHQSVEHYGLHWHWIFQKYSTVFGLWV